MLLLRFPNESLLRRRTIRGANHVVGGRKAGLNEELGLILYVSVNDICRPLAKRGAMDRSTASVCDIDAACKAQPTGDIYSGTCSKQRIHNATA